ncbi:MAG: metalloregulator ArsR/SmtB family transcription factor [Pseudomonadota bacterium]
MTAVDLTPGHVAELADTFGLLSDPTRLSIVIACMNQERSAGDISGALGASPSLTSHHLRLLRSARILRSERRGTQVFYSMADDCVRRVLKIMIEHVFTHQHIHEGPPHA